MKEGQKANVPVSPFMDIDSVVLKNKNIEGGMGIHFFKNATEGTVKSIFTPNIKNEMFIK